MRFLWYPVKPSSRQVLLSAKAKNTYQDLDKPNLITDHFIIHF